MGSIITFFKPTRIILIVAWILLSMYYYTSYYRFSAYTRKYDTYYYNNSDDENYLLNTPGCRIPNYMKTIHINEAKRIYKTCGQRAIYIDKITEDSIIFRIDEKIMNTYKNKYRNSQNITYNCCYQFAGPFIKSGKTDYTKLRYSACMYLKNGTISPLKEEVITVTCDKRTGNKKIIIYEDSYIILKKIKKSVEPINYNRWNILLIGMDTMSRARAYSSMPKTMQYFKDREWLDYRGYQKVGYNTFPNIASFLSGKEIKVVEKACASGMDNCNKLFLWSDLHKSGFVTAYGEDFINLPDTFSRYNGFKNKPTDHYVRPLFLTGENDVANLECTKKLPSVKHMLNYATDFTTSYKNVGFYGMFWINSYSHNLNNNPTLFEDDLIAFLENLNKTTVLDNTFVFFLSDHGLRYGGMRVQYETYYDERLPMLFVWVPKKFRQSHRSEYENLQINQYRLTSPYDLYLTMWDTYRVTNESVPMKISEACTQCKSLMSDISPHRTCIEAGVDEKWCSCHNMTKANIKNENVKRSIALVVEQLQNRSQSIKTVKCTKCEKLQLKTVHRVHEYNDNNKTYHIIALAVTGDISFETTVVHNDDSIKILQPTYTISKYNTKGSCALGKYERVYCICKKLSNCKNKPKR